MIGTVEVAERLGVSHRIVVGWAQRWYGPVGSGCPQVLEPGDVLVARAWQVLHGGSPHRDPQRELLCVMAEEAIRMRPRRWLLINAERAETYDTAEDAGDAWWAAPTPSATLIDLWSLPHV